MLQLLALVTVICAFGALGYWSQHFMVLVASTHSSHQGIAPSSPIKLKIAPGSEKYEAKLEKQLNQGTITAQGERVVPNLGGTAPIWELCLFIDSEHQVDRFSMDWAESVFQWRRSGSAHYNRQTGILTEYLDDGDEQGGSRTTYTYTGVTDQALHQLENDSSFSGAEHGVTFSALAKYACTRSEHQDVETLPTPVG